MNELTNGLKCFIESHDDNASFDSQTFYTVELSARIRIPHRLKYEVRNGLKSWENHVELLDIRIEEIANFKLNNDVPHKIITVKPSRQDNRYTPTVSPNPTFFSTDQIGIYIDIPEVQSDSQDINDINDNENSSNVDKEVLKSSDLDTSVSQFDDDYDNDDFLLKEDSDDSWSPENEQRQKKCHPGRQTTRTRRLSSRIKTKSGINKEADEEEDCEIPCDTKSDKRKKRFKGSSTTQKCSSNVQNSGAELNTKQRRVSKPKNKTIMTKEEESSNHNKIWMKTKVKQKSSVRKAKFSAERMTRHKRRASDVRTKHVLTCKHCGETFDKIRNYNIHLDTHETDCSTSEIENSSDQRNCLNESVPDVHMMITSTSQDMNVTAEDLKEVQLTGVHESNLPPNINQDITEKHNQENAEVSIVKNFSSAKNPLKQTILKLKDSTTDFVDEKYDSAAEKSKEQAIFNKDVKKSKKNYDILTCEYCGKYFGRIDVYTNHILTHSTERLYQCNKCNKSFKNKPTLNSHQLITHSSQEFQCDICNKYFTLKATLKSHVATVHNGERNEICHICGKSFSRKEHLKKHISLHSDLKPFKCDDCHKHFQTEILLRSHKKHHLMEAKHICDICGRAFKTPSNLKSHQLSHSGVRNFACSICNMAFIHKASMKKHLRTHDSNRKVVQCNLCGKIFKNQTNLNRHNITAHSDLKPFQCEFCSKTFKLKSLLDQHANIHKVEKNYSCKYCDKKFAFNSSLYSHVKCHHKEKLNVSDLETGVKCYLCGNFFESNFALASHVRTHNNNVCI